MQLVAAIVLAGVILYYLRTLVVALNNTERHYTAFALVLTVAVDLGTLQPAMTLAGVRRARCVPKATLTRQLGNPIRRL